MRFFGLLSFILASFFGLAQPQYTRQDSLRGSITPEREWWDLNYYHLDIAVYPKSKSIGGSNTVSYTVLAPHQVMQIDLQPPLKITRVSQDGKDLQFISEGNAHFVQLTKEQVKGEKESLVIEYSGQPKEAVRPPWDGGITWKKDEKGVEFIASSCQGLGASVWWPCKDHMYDEVDSMLMSVEVPEHLTNVSNGRLVKTTADKKKKTKTYHWLVTNPINNYGVNINIGNYASWTETYKGENGDLDLNYWVLAHNLKKAKVHFQDGARTIEAFEHWFGPYPFYEDSYKLVEAPYLGMEHQSSVTYGNGYEKGYRGRDLSGTGWGLKFDFIIVHESGHEWFANSITHKDAADMWLHESFTAYSESLFLDYHYGKEAGLDYVLGTRMNIQNQYPIVGPYGVNYEIPDTDAYYKGANVLNMLRYWIGDDAKWRKLLRQINKEFYHQTISSREMEAYISQKSGLRLEKFFDQYLRDRRVPVLEYFEREGKTYYRWTNVIDGFDMPLKVKLNGEEQTMTPTLNWQDIKGTEIEVNVNYYISLMKVQ